MPDVALPLPSALGAKIDLQQIAGQCRGALVGGPVDGRDRTPRVAEIRQRDRLPQRDHGTPRTCRTAEQQSTAGRTRYPNTTPHRKLTPAPSPKSPTTAATRWNTPSSHAAP